MVVNRDFVGREYPSDGYEVGREHLRSFAAAIGDPNAAYTDPAAARALGYRDVIAPPTYLIVLASRFAEDGPIADPAFGLDWSVVVHGDQTFEHDRPVVAGDVLNSTQLIEEIRDAGRNEMIRIVTRVTGQDGEQVASIRSTLVSRGTAAPRQPAATPTPEPADRA